MLVVAVDVGGPEKIAGRPQAVDPGTVWIWPLRSATSQTLSTRASLSR